jgi:PAS domain S-box-containing protein
MSRSKKSSPSTGGQVVPSKRPGLGLRPRVVLDSVSDAVITINAAGQIRGWSEQAHRILGWSADEVVGRPWTEVLMPSGDRRDHETFLTHVRESHTPGPLRARWEFSIMRKDGLALPVEVSATAVLLGALKLFCVFARDITERKDAERAKKLFEQLVNSSNDAIVTNTLDGIITSWNLGAERLYGYAAQEMLGSPISTITPPERLAEEETARERVRRGVLVESYETERLRKDGTRITVSNSLSPINEDGSIVGIAAIGRDISGRKQAEAERDLFFALSPDLLCISDLDGFFIRLSPSWERVLGHSLPELMERPFLALVHEDDRAATVAEMEKLARGIPTVSFNNRYRCKDGSFRWLAWSATPEPRRRVIFATARDVTEQRHLEEQFRQAQKMEAVGRLAAGVAHDFNNLLTVVLATTDLLLDDLPPEAPSRADLDEIRHVAVRGSRLTAQLLTFARKQVLAPTILDLNAVVNGAQNLLMRLVGESVTIKTVLAPNLSPIRADAGQLEQVLVNLAVNARDAMPQTGSLLIETANAELDDASAQMYLRMKPGKYVMLAVTDTGTGMDAATKAHIFEPFFTTKAAGKGTGLGLSTVFGIVEQSGGRIHVYSEPGLGTSFKMYFPPTSGEVSDATTAAVIPKSLNGTETVLVVDDDEALRHLAARLLRAHGYQVLEASNSTDALQVSTEHANPIDLVVSDVVMPGMSGPELVNLLVQRRPGLRALFMSGYTDESLPHVQMLRPGVNYLPKPFSRRQLAELVRSILDGP